MSALAPKADMCGANRHVCFGPIADVGLGPYRPYGSIDQVAQPKSKTPFCCLLNAAEYKHSKDRDGDCPNARKDEGSHDPPSLQLLSKGPISFALELADVE
jgi:hypothetical protein